MYLEGSGVDGTGTELVIVQEQVLKVSDQGQSISGDAVDDILLQMKKHKTARQTLWDCTQVVIWQVKTLETAQVAAGRAKKSFFNSDVW